MTQLERLLKLNEYLLDEAPEYRREAERFGGDEGEQFRLFRSLSNLRPPKKASGEFLALQDEYLSAAARDKGVVTIESAEDFGGGLYLWQGDITRLAADAIVNAANSGLTGCYIPCHNCIDNCIHTFAGARLRLECAQMMQKQGREEPPGRAKLTRAYALPCKYVLHTVGPAVGEALTPEDEALLASCYRSCLELAEEKGIGSLAFCCISTGVFRFPNREAAEIAVGAVRGFLKERRSGLRVIFNVFKDEDYAIYKKLLS